MNFAREGYGFMAVAAVATVIGFATAWMMRSYSLWLFAFLLAIVALWVAYFFRDPERTGPRGDRVVVCPADGKLIMITQVDEPAFIHGQAIRLSIFMNVFDVHVNRYPVSGRVDYKHYNPGKFLNAAAEKSSLENEQSTIGIDAGPRKVIVRQIAGLIARRIVTYPDLGDSVQQGDRLGIIRFGSRVDVFLPLGSTVLAKLGDRTVAGTTVLAELP
ncbi:MAG TPA: phosphatidylserine decarboxylase family protein [Gemmatimonadaceae bacterium]|nr:phosphatidylserine decarboxylase family protein [Gemmatimonadaceae bacterium]